MNAHAFDRLQAASRRRPAFRSGFTLLELMIALAVAALIMAVGLPAFVHAMKKEGLRKAVSDIVEGCSSARVQSILRGVPMEFVLRAEDGQMAVQQAKLEGNVWASSSASAGGEAETAPRAAPFSRQLADDVGIKLLFVNLQDHMELPEARVRFYPNGKSDEFAVVLFSTSGETKIMLDMVTGQADVEVLR